MIVTNALGVAFTAVLLSASDVGASFVFPEDGATNTLVWTRLSEDSRNAVVALTGFEPVPPALTAVFAQAKRDRQRIDAMVAEKTIDASDAVECKLRLRAAFLKACRKKGIDDERAKRLAERCLDAR